MAASGIDSTPTGDPSTGTAVTETDFANKKSNNDPYAGDLQKVAGSDDMKLDEPASPTSPTKKDRSQSREWDASKVPPSQFQKRKGSIYSTPSSRDSHVKGSSRDQAYFEKLKEKGWGGSGGGSGGAPPSK